MTSGHTESEPLRYAGDRDLSGFFNSLGKSLAPGLSLSKLSLANGMVTRDSCTAGASATGDWFARGECARLREFVQVPPPRAWVDVGDPLREHRVHGRQTARPVRVERSGDLKTEVVGTLMAGPTLDNVVKEIIKTVA